MPNIKCPKCGKVTNTVFIDGLFDKKKSNGCYLQPEQKDGVWKWVRGCVAEKDLNSYLVYSAKSYLNKPILVNGKPLRAESIIDDRYEGLNAKKEKTSKQKQPSKVSKVRRANQKDDRS